MQFNFENIKKNIKGIVVAKAIQGAVMSPLSAEAPKIPENTKPKEIMTEQTETTVHHVDATPLDLDKKM